MTDVLWRNRSPKEGTPTVHVLVIGVSSYDHLPGGTGEQSTAAMLSGLSQLSAAATSATRIALWIRNTFDFPNVQLGTVRLLASPSPAELPLPDDVAPPPATYDEVRKAVAGWLKDARSGDGNVSVLYVAGHGIQTSSEGGIVLLQDVGAPDSIRILERAIDVASVRLGMVADPAAADTCTPPVQYYFYDACRVVPPATAAYEELKAGVFLDIAKGAAPTTSYVLWGSSAGDYALADPETRETLFSAAFTEALESRAPVGPDGRTVRLAEFGLALETLVAELADQHGEQQNVTPGGSGPFSTPVYLRPAARSASRGPGDPARPPPPAPSISPPTDSIAPGAPAPPPSVRPPQPPPSVVDDTPVAVVARASNDSHFALTFLNTRDAIVASGFTGSPTQLLPGSYRAVVQLPWGGTAEAEFDVAPGSTTMQIDVATPTEADGFAVAMPRLDRQLGPIGAGVDWSVRFLVTNPAPAEDVGPFLCSPSDTWPTMTVTDIGPDGVTLALTAHSPQLHYMQVRTADGRSVVIALPIVQYAEAESSCNVVVRASSDALGAIVRFTDPLKDTIGGYLTGGRADHVTALAPSAESMLQSKMPRSARRRARWLRAAAPQRARSLA